MFLSVCFLIFLMAFGHKLGIVFCQNDNSLFIHWINWWESGGVIGFGRSHIHVLVWYTLTANLDFHLLIHISGAPLSHQLRIVFCLLSLKLHTRLTRSVLLSSACSCALASSSEHSRSSPVGNTPLELGPWTWMLFTYTFLFCSISLHVSSTV